MPFDRINLGEAGGAKPYIPSFAAPEEILDDAYEVQDPLGALVANGLLPGAKSGGIIEVGGGRQLGLDFVAIEGDRKYVTIYPSDKAGVRVSDPAANIGRPVSEGVSVVSDRETLREGRAILSIAGMNTGNFWEAEAARAEGHRVFCSRQGLWVVQIAMMWGEIEDINGRTGETRVRLFDTNL